jgi:poly-gamma-glutamate capsule biosynthesis protein CapA/YwtB (metallophosphatase superfamily)
MVRLFLAGDVMTGRGIDQILPHPCAPEIYEDYLRSALSYVVLAEDANGPIPKPVDYAWIWGDALGELSTRRPDARIVNLETAITVNEHAEPKGINYRMNPANIPVLKEAGIGCCVLANNHVLDWGERGLLDTLAALENAGIPVAGAGKNLAEARRPAALSARGSNRVRVSGVGHESSGIPRHWAAREKQPGVWLLKDLSEESAQELAREVEAQREDGDIVVISIHWGSNWGHEISGAQRAFAHKLIDLGACDVLHGHSSHHARAAEIYRRKLILYGCGDFINDYEGITGHEEYRGDLSSMYFADIGEAGTLEALTVAVFQMHRFRLRYAYMRDVRWFQAALNRHSRDLGVHFLLTKDGSLYTEP